MFFIMNETELKKNEPLDSIKEIGVLSGVKYYYVTGTGSEVGALLKIADTHSAVRQTAKYEVDETELRLAAQDWEKLQQMQNEISSVQNSFKPIAKQPQ